MRIRKPSDDDVSTFDIVALVVTVLVIVALVLWGLGLV